LTVENGLGSGFYEAGEYARVSAFIPEGYRMVAWEGDALYVEDIFQSNTAVNMPPQQVEITAYTLPVNEVSFQYEVFPLFTTYCSISGCHAKSENGLTNLTSYEEIKRTSSIGMSYVKYYVMPLSITMPDSARQLMVDWYEQGVKNN
jgi:hypothetical protein